ncbi:hypothetical protein P154DRAFT_516532 [Amniculicola lignicola CBS 123094]|uniref:Uncharacterized protein n=1 Tax=Amniculicola lignicola CBS 123094 TaxID=1392246 RepID=A0A6A5X4A9_9PLEO|nr:hypothetical protein P154DRAFT_516532 [Amniculicola lignicola CBS 123094]
MPIFCTFKRKLMKKLKAGGPVKDKKGQDTPSFVRMSGFKDQSQPHTHREASSQTEEQVEIVQIRPRSPGLSPQRRIDSFFEEKEEKVEAKDINPPEKRRSRFKEEFGTVKVGYSAYWILYVGCWLTHFGRSRSHLESIKHSDEIPPRFRWQFLV